MNLNTGVLDDLGDMVQVDGDLIKAPNPAVPSTDTTLITTQAASLIVPPVVPQGQLDSIANSETTLQLVEGKQQKVVDLKTIEATILGENAISQEDVSYLSESFESLKDGYVSIKEYTEHRSRTNFAYVQRAMNRQIATEQQALISNVQLLLSTPLEEAKQFYAQAVESYIPTVQNQLFNLTALVATIEEAIKDTKNSIFVYGTDGNFVNLKTVDIAKLNIGALRAANQLSAEILGIIETLIDLCNKPHVANFIHGVIENKPIASIIDFARMRVYDGVPISLETLVSFYKANPREALNQLCDVLETQFLGKLTQIAGNSVADVPAQEVVTADSIDVKLSQDLPVIQETFSKMRYTAYLINALAILNFASSKYMTFVSKL